MIYKSQEELEGALAYWQRALRLQDVRVFCTLASSAELECEATAFTCKRFPSAMIKILRHEDWRGSKPGEWNCHPERDMEADLVHELLHVAMVLFEPSPKDGLVFDVYERFVESMAHALVAMRRAGADPAIRPCSC